ncbi:hypothetical protein RhiLY_05943 [Ceratobasidium sp. AG-Ba]|nr:hypothetical protein RhiLY_05943 [Ceratobasidium sp. AG-Ba]
MASVRLPPELLQRVARWCPVDEYLAMMLLDRASYLNLIQSFYKIVVVGSVAQFDMLAETILSDRTLVGRTPLRLKPRGLAVSVPNAHRGQTPDPSKLVQVLCALPRLEQLRLNLSRSCIEAIFSSGNISNVEFKLRDLHCQINPTMFDFLRHQDGIEFYNILGLPSLEARGLADVTKETDTYLPKLRRVEGGWTTVKKLIPGRPISRLLATHPDRDPVETIVQVMTQATAPLTEFADVRYFPVGPFGDFVISWLKHLEYAGGSLEKFQLFFNLPLFDTSNTYALLPPKRVPSSVTIDPENLVPALKPFKYLRVIEIEIGYSHGPVVRPTFDLSQLGDFQLWKDACPSLRFVKLLDDVLCEK